MGTKQNCGHPERKTPRGGQKPGEDIAGKDKARRTDLGTLLALVMGHQ